MHDAVVPTDREHRTTYLPVSSEDEEETDSERESQKQGTNAHHPPSQPPHTTRPFISPSPTKLTQKSHFGTKKTRFREGLSISLYLKPPLGIQTHHFLLQGLSASHPLHQTDTSLCTHNARSTHPPDQTRRDQSTTRAPPPLPRSRARTPPTPCSHKAPTAHNHHLLPIAHKTLFAEKETPTLKEYIQGGQNKHRMYI